MNDEIIQYSSIPSRKQRFSLIGFLAGLIAVMHVFSVFLFTIKYKEIYNDFHLQLPPITEIYHDVADWLFGYYFAPALIIPVGCGFVLPLFNPILARNPERVLRAATAMVLLVIFLIVFNMIALYAIYQPMMTLLTGMTGKGGR